jgi:hypothetical protein
MTTFGMSGAAGRATARDSRPNTVTVASECSILGRFPEWCGRRYLELKGDSRLERL